jgi:hypothetical protein
MPKTIHCQWCSCLISAGAHCPFCGAHKEKTSSGPEAKTYKDSLPAREKASLRGARRQRMHDQREHEKWLHHQVTGRRLLDDEF